MAHLTAQEVIASVIMCIVVSSHWLSYHAVWNGTWMHRSLMKELLLTSKTMSHLMVLRVATHHVSKRQHRLNLVRNTKIESILTIVAKVERLNWVHARSKQDALRCR